MPGEHAKLSPSSAARWMACPGSAALTAAGPGMADSSEYAAEGTALHKWAAECLEFDFEPSDLIGQTLTVDGHITEFTKEFADLMLPGLDRLREFAGSMVVERRVHLDRWLPGQFGTLDCGIIGRNEIVIADWKWGAGVAVSPIENPQLMLYALGFWDCVARHQSEAGTFRLIIEQPRIPGGGGEWCVSLDDLLAFSEQARAAGKRTEDPDAPLVAGETQCRFCAARTVCPELARFNLDLLGKKFDDLDADAPPVLPAPLSPERRAYVVRHADLMRRWLDDLHADTLAGAMAGRPTPGLKVVAGRRPARVWRNPAEAETFLLERLSRGETFTTTLKSPAQVEKLLPRAEMKAAEPLIDTGGPKPTLVPVTDKRPALAPYAMKFDDLTKQRGADDE